MRRWLPYLLALVAYVALGYVFRSAILNWIVGPLWLLLTLDVIPRALGFGPIGQPADEEAES
jgi:hypothetical protein